MGFWYTSGGGACRFTTRKLPIIVMVVNFVVVVYWLVMVVLVVMVGVLALVVD